MKNKKYLYGFVILLVLLCLGIGYAAVSKTLTINGTANATAAGEDDLIVVFTGSVDTKCKTTTNNTTTATIVTDNLTTVGDTATAVITIQNKSPNLAAQVKNLDFNFENAAHDKYFDITVSDVNTKLAAAGGTTTVTVTIELATLPVETVAAKFTVTLKATAVE